jgi:5-oxoprolinase (ATP-hydrolysing)
VRRKNGRLERLKGADQTVLEEGEAIIIKTPTGGGYGPKKARHSEVRPRMRSRGASKPDRRC